MSGKQPGAAFYPEHKIFKSSKSPAVIKYLTLKIISQHTRVIVNCNDIPSK